MTTQPALDRQPAPAGRAAIVLAGGRARRLGGADKAALEVGGSTLLDLALAAVAPADPVVVVAPAGVAGRPGVRVVSERPAYGGPAAGLLTALATLPLGVRRVVVLAVDLPGVSAATVARLSEATTGDGSVLVDSDGRRQPVLVLDVARLRAVAPPEAAWTGLALHRLLAPLTLAEVPAVGPEARDVDTPEDLRRWTAD